MQKRAVFCVYVIFWEQSWQAGVENGAMLIADHIYIQIYFRTHHFVVKFTSPQAARGHWPPNQNPADVPVNAPRHRRSHGCKVGVDTDNPQNFSPHSFAVSRVIAPPLVYPTLFHLAVKFCLSRCPAKNDKIVAKVGWKWTKCTWSPWSPKLEGPRPTGPRSGQVLEFSVAYHNTDDQRQSLQS